MDYRTDAEIAADRQRRQAQEQPVAELLNLAVSATDRLAVTDATRVELSALFANWARIPRSVPNDVLALARAVVVETGEA